MNEDPEVLRIVEMITEKKILKTSAIYTAVSLNPPPHTPPHTPPPKKKDPRTQVSKAP
jgi:hypothetical protein